MQILIVFVGGAAFQVHELPPREWAVSIVIGLFSMVVGALMRCLPDVWFERLWVMLHIMEDPNKLPGPSWNPALDKVQEQLTVFQRIRGGRLRGSSKQERLLEKNDIQLCVLSFPRLASLVALYSYGTSFLQVVSARDGANCHRNIRRCRVVTPPQSCRWTRSVTFGRNTMGRQVIVPS